MATGERAAGRSGRRRGPAGQGSEAGGTAMPLARTPRTGARVLAAFRIPKPLHTTMAEESRAEGLDLTAYVNRIFDGFLHYFGLPTVIRENLERDREALGVSRYEYLQYVLYRRHEAVAEHGEAFDRAPKRK